MLFGGSKFTHNRHGRSLTPPEAREYRWAQHDIHSGAARRIFGDVRAWLASALLCVKCFDTFPPMV